MEWERLFLSRRLGRKQSGTFAQASEGRSEFQRDFDRVIFSAAFRRLQNKTQVVPLPENDFVHTRLTHSLEASCVGRSLGRIAGDRIIKMAPERFAAIGVTAADFEAVVAAACLAHDIGNPPFGHSGEDAISTYFRSPAAAKFLHRLNKKEVADLQNFEGNAAGFRLLTRTPPAHSEIDIGLGLTLATLGAFTKYPKPSLPDLRDSKNASEKKFGFFQSEQQTFKSVADELGLIARHDSGAPMWRRHPLAFLVEAADDICYSIIDFEDGFKLGRVSFETFEALFMAIIADDFLTSESFYQKTHDQREKAGLLRAKAINKLVWESADIFMENLDHLLQGTFDTPLRKLIPAAQSLDEISKISFEQIYKARAIVEIEVAGYEVLAGLLDIWLNAVFDGQSNHSLLVKQLMPDSHLAGADNLRDDYSRIMTVTEFVAGMTDNFAINAYRKLKGISLPSDAFL